jgi:D-arabinose 1-dehydrogenase-like Zn-dependent alcohol dehydrogenase
MDFLVLCPFTPLQDVCFSFLSANTCPLPQSCGKCSYCLSGNDIWCDNRDIYGEASFDTGTFGTYYVGAETYLHRIPDALSSADAAPLQCAGATVYAALINVIQPGRRVAVLGIGGLGHLAIQFAAKLGAEVVVFSSSPDKESEARAFGASEFYLLSEPEKIRSPVDVLVLTGSKYPDFPAYVLAIPFLPPPYSFHPSLLPPYPHALTSPRFMKKEILARTGTVVPLTASASQALALPALRLLFDGYNVRSSLVASRRAHDDMLRFAALHAIKPAVELFPLDEHGWESALDRLESGAVRYRAVLTSE